MKKSALLLIWTISANNLFCMDSNLEIENSTDTQIIMQEVKVDEMENLKEPILDGTSYDDNTEPIFDVTNDLLEITTNQKSFSKKCCLFRSCFKQ